MRNIFRCVSRAAGMGIVHRDTEKASEEYPGNQNDAKQVSPPESAGGFYNIQTHQG
jgi:hypothetical protein